MWIILLQFVIRTIHNYIVFLWTGTLCFHCVKVWRFGHFVSNMVAFCPAWTRSTILSLRYVQTSLRPSSETISRLKVTDQLIRPHGSKGGPRHRPIDTIRTQRISIEPTTNTERIQQHSLPNETVIGHRPKHSRVLQERIPTLTEVTRGSWQAIKLRLLCSLWNAHSIVDKTSALISSILEH